MKYITTPILIEAIQFMGKNLMAVSIFLRGQQIEEYKDETSIVIKIGNEKVKVKTSDWVVRDQYNKFFVIKDNVFTNFFKRI